jgi:regulator of sirC expression with transglutaminase-like and TPR domain
MNQLEARELFERLLASPDDDVDLLRAALAIAAEEHAGLDVTTWVRKLHDLTGDGLDPQADEAERHDYLQRRFFDELAFGGEGCDFDDPECSFLPSVVERRSGLPIALSVIYVQMGRRLGLACSGVAFPGHFLAKVHLERGEVFVDPFRRKRELTVDDLARRLATASGGRQKLDRSMLATAPPKLILARMLRNLKNLYAKQRDFARAFSAADRVLLCQPESWEDLRDRGLYCVTLGWPEIAQRDLRRYLEQVPQAADSNAIRIKLQGLGSSRVLLN